MYKVQRGDTLQSISRKVYGTESQAELISSANPGATLKEGEILSIPKQDQATPTQSDNPDEVAILIDQKRFRFWDSVRVTRSIDSMDTVEFTAPFEADERDFQEAFRPFSFKPVSITVGGDVLFTGTMVAVNPVLSESKTVTVSCYSKPGVLGDCTPPASMLERLEFNLQDLESISKELAKPFGVQVVFNDGPGEAFERVACSPSAKVLDFLVELAKQRNLIISSDEQGRLLFWRSQKSPPVAVLNQEPPVTAVMPFFSPQEYYSHITGIEPVIVGTEGSQHTVKNSRLQGVTRPMTFTAQDTEGENIVTATQAKASRMFGNMAAYTVSVATWRDPQGNLWKPNTTVKLTAPDAMIYEPYLFTIRSISFERSDSMTAELDLVIPESFSGGIPESLPWEQ